MTIFWTGGAQGLNSPSVFVEMSGANPPVRPAAGTPVQVREAISGTTLHAFYDRAGDPITTVLTLADGYLIFGVDDVKVVEVSADAWVTVSRFVLASAVEIALDQLDEVTGELASVSEQADTTTTGLAALAGRVTTLELGSGGGGGGAATAWPGYVLLGDFSGSDSTAKMRTALATLSAETAGTRRALIIPPGTVLAPGTTPFQLSNGIAIVGGVIPTTEFSYQSRVTISGSCPNGVFQLKKNSATNPETGTANPSTGTQTRGVIFANIAWEGNSGAAFLQENFTEQLSYSLFHGCSWDNFSYVIHQRMLGVMLTGMGYCNNSTVTPFILSGSDYKFFMDGYYLDSPNLADDQFLIEIRTGNKAVLGSVFVTGDGPTPVKVTAGQEVVINDMQMEAEGIPRRTAGAGLWVAGGNVTVKSAWFFRTMFNPSSAVLAAAGRTDNGVIHVTGGHLRLGAVTFGEYNTSETHTENHISCTGGTVLAEAPLVWNLEGASGTGLPSLRALATARSGAGAISRSSYTAL
jgi:hypothetical protein